MKITMYGSTHQGMVRSNNEDTYILESVWDKRHVLAVVIDGMGGYEGGEVAAEIARETITATIRGNEDQNNPLSVLKRAVTDANNAIVERKLIDPSRSQMGCVLTATLFDFAAMKLYVAHVGDTRLYRYSDGVLRKLTHDHSMVGFREEMGELTEEEAMHHPNRNLIERAVGEAKKSYDAEGFIDAAVFPILSDSQYMLCSDGLCDMVMSSEMSGVMSNPELTAKAKTLALIDLANSHGGKDNVTVVLVQIKGATGSKLDNVKELTTSSTGAPATMQPEQPQPAATPTVVRETPTPRQEPPRDKASTQPTGSEVATKPDDATQSVTSSRVKRIIITLLLIVFLAGIGLGFVFSRIGAGKTADSNTKNDTTAVVAPTDTLNTDSIPDSH